jgi:putative lipoic acid-binding regulatory protein
MNDRRPKEKPDIAYPCPWTFKLFGTDENLLREAVAELMPLAGYELTLSRTSSRGRYLCMNLELTVVSDEDRTSVFEALNAHSQILLVL